MKKRFMVMLLAFMLGCTACTALPAEERAFALALCVEKTDGVWRVYSRIPAYQTGGEYLTVTGEGDTLPLALVDMEGNAPMHLHLSQLRLLVLDAELGKTTALTEALSILARQQDMALQCEVAVSRDNMQDVADAMKPPAGARLSKAMDVLIQSRKDQGAVLPASLADVIRMGTRQSPVLMKLSLDEGSIRLSGGFPMTTTGMLAEPLSVEETALLSLLLKQSKNPVLRISDNSVRIRENSCRAELSPDLKQADVMLRLRLTDHEAQSEQLEKDLADACLILLERLSQNGCDVLGLGRQAIVRKQDMAQWEALDWSSVYRHIRWQIGVSVQGMT